MPPHPFNEPSKMLCSLSSVVRRASFQANGHTSYLHISGGFALVLGIQETIAIIVVLLCFLVELLPPFSFSLTMFYFRPQARLESIDAPKYYVLLTHLISCLTTLVLPTSEIFLDPLLLLRYRYSLIDTSKRSLFYLSSR